MKENNQGGYAILIQTLEPDETLSFFQNFSIGL